MPPPDKQPSHAHPLRVALVGYGVAGAVFHASLIAATPGMLVAAIVTNNAERRMQALRDFPKVTLYASAEALWRDASRYDLAVIATPNCLHVPLGIAAMEHGLAVVVDKPMAPSVTEALKLINISKETGKLLTVFQNRRWDNDFRTVRSLLDSGRLGAITRFESRFERYRPSPKYDTWRESGEPEQAGGLLYDLGSHLIDQAMVLFGKPTQVYAEVERRRPAVQVDDDTFVALQFANRVRAHLWVSSVARVPGPRMRISGLHGTYEKWGLDPQEDALRSDQRPGHSHWGREPREKWGHLLTDSGDSSIDGPLESLPGAYEQFYALLHLALVMKGPPPVDPLESVAVLRVIEAAQESAKCGKTVDMQGS